ncbi:SapB/AmfS family lanthipeptide (plasmid) [Streptomyces sp. CG4]
MTILNLQTLPAANTEDTPAGAGSNISAACGSFFSTNCF